MRFQKTECHKEWFARSLLGRAQSTDGLVRYLAVGISCVRHIGIFVSSAPREFRYIRFVGKERFFARPSCLYSVLRQAIRNRVPANVRHRPRCGIFMVTVAYVKNFPQRFGAVAMA